jgi:hypothetical protein
MSDLKNGKIQMIGVALTAAVAENKMLAIIVERRRRITAASIVADRKKTSDFSCFKFQIWKAFQLPSPTYPMIASSCVGLTVIGSNFFNSGKCDRI